MLELTCFMLKPDAVSRGLVDQIFKRVIASGLKIIQKKDLSITNQEADRLYAVHRGKHFFEGLKKFITSGPIIVSIVQGEGAIDNLRGLMGATDPRKATAGTIRGDLREENVLTPYGIIKNLVHGSDSKESAEYEIPIFFKEQ